MYMHVMFVQMLISEGINALSSPDEVSIGGGGVTIWEGWRGVIFTCIMYLYMYTVQCHTCTLHAYICLLRQSFQNEIRTVYNNLDEGKQFHLDEE